MKVTILLKTTCAVKFNPTVKEFVSFCPALDLYSQGPTPKDAEIAMISSLKLYLTHAYAHGLLFSKLHRMGLFPSDDATPVTSCPWVLKPDEWLRISEVEAPLELSWTPP